MPNDQLQADILEAYTIAPTDVVLLETLELRHPSFVDDNGDPTAIRIVANQRDQVIVTLEADAPLNGGETVPFIGFAVDFTLPEIRNDEQAEMVLTIDNVGREIMRHIEAAIDDGSSIEVTYRPYLSSDLSTPQRVPPITMQLADITADQYKIQARFRYDELFARQFPRRVYTIEQFPGLAP